MKQRGITTLMIIAIISLVAALILGGYLIYSFMHKNVYPTYSFPRASGGMEVSALSVRTVKVDLENTGYTMIETVPTSFEAYMRLHISNPLPTSIYINKIHIYPGDKEITLPFTITVPPYSERAYTERASWINITFPQVLLLPGDEIKVDSGGVSIEKRRTLFIWNGTRVVSPDYQCPQYGTEIAGIDVEGRTVISLLRMPGCSPLYGYSYGGLIDDKHKLLYVFDVEPNQTLEPDKDVNFYMQFGYTGVGFYDHGEVYKWVVEDSLGDWQNYDISGTKGIMLVNPDYSFNVSVINETGEINWFTGVFSDLNPGYPYVGVGLARKSKSPLPPIIIIVKDKDNNPLYKYVIYYDAHLYMTYIYSDGDWVLVNKTHIYDATYDPSAVLQQLKTVGAVFVRNMLDPGHQYQFSVTLTDILKYWNNPSAVATYEIDLPDTGYDAEDDAIIFWDMNHDGLPELVIRATTINETHGRLAPIMVREPDDLGYGHIYDVYFGGSEGFKKDWFVNMITAGTNPYQLTELHLTLTPVLWKDTGLDAYMGLAYDNNTLILLGSHGWVDPYGKVISFYYGWGHLVNQHGLVIVKIYPDNDTIDIYPYDGRPYFHGFVVFRATSWLDLALVEVFNETWGIHLIHSYGKFTVEYVKDAVERAREGYTDYRKYIKYSIIYPQFVSQYEIKSVYDPENHRFYVVGGESELHVVKYVCDKLDNESFLSPSCWKDYVLPNPDGCYIGRREEITPDGNYVLATGPNCKYAYLFKYNADNDTYVLWKKFYKGIENIVEPDLSDGDCCGGALTITDPKLSYILITTDYRPSTIGDVIKIYKREGDSFVPVFAYPLREFGFYNPFYGWYKYLNLRALVAGEKGSFVLYDILGGTGYIIRGIGKGLDAVVSPDAKWADLGGVIVKLVDYQVPRIMSINWTGSYVSTDVNYIGIFGGQGLEITGLWSQDRFIVCGVSVCKEFPGTVTYIDLVKTFGVRELVDTLELQGGFTLQIVISPEHLLSMLFKRISVEMRTGKGDLVRVIDLPITLRFTKKVWFWYRGTGTGIETVTWFTNNSVVTNVTYPDGEPLNVSFESNRLIIYFDISVYNTTGPKPSIYISSPRGSFGVEMIGPTKWKINDPYNVLPPEYHKLVGNNVELILGPESGNLKIGNMVIKIYDNNTAVSTRIYVLNPNGLVYQLIYK